MMTGFYTIIPNALSPDKCDEVIRSVTTITEAMVGPPHARRLDHQARRALVNWLDIEADRNLHDQLKALMDSANATFRVDARTLRQAQYTLYDGAVGGHYGWHTDSTLHAWSDSVDRKLSMSIQLSDPSEYDGGAFEFFKGGAVPGFKAKGTALVFPSFLLHRVTPVTRGSRCALVAWLEGPAWR